MTPDERVAEAITDLEGLLAEGAEIAVAISESASLYQLKPEVLRLRAEKKLGDLQAVCERYARLRIQNDRERRLKKTVQEYVDTFFSEHPKSQLPFIPINNWIRKERNLDTGG